MNQILLKDKRGKTLMVNLDKLFEKLPTNINSINEFYNYNNCFIFALKSGDEIFIAKVISVIRPRAIVKCNYYKLSRDKYNSSKKSTVGDFVYLESDKLYWIIFNNKIVL